MDLVRRGFALTQDRTQLVWLCPLLLVADAALTGIVIRKIPYTEIDWTTYMQFMTQYTSGERDYIKLHGSTGPCVYPAGFIYIYRALYSLTASGTDIATAQWLFAGLYLTTLALVMNTYSRAGSPPWLFPLLVLSKRLHSIFVLRLFNDAFAVMFLFLAIALWQRRWWTLGSCVFSLGVGVKMSLLLPLPVVGLLLWQALGLERAFQQAMLMGQLQVILAYPFFGHWRSYLGRAFEFTRQFMFKWTVNWRFVGEERFLSATFSRSLLAAHAGLLFLFLVTRWLHTSLGEAIDQIAQPPSKEQQARIARRVHPDSILTTVLTALLIGCLCARSLHYQFYAYIFWATPFLLWRSGLHPVVVYAVVGLQEWAWNVYPSTDATSMTVVACLAFTVASIWVGLGRKPHASSETIPPRHEVGKANPQKRKQ